MDLAGDEAFTVGSKKAGEVAKLVKVDGFLRSAGCEHLEVFLYQSQGRFMK